MDADTSLLFACPEATDATTGTSIRRQLAIRNDLDEAAIMQEHAIGER
jgi:hypothetical protein